MIIIVQVCYFLFGSSFCRELLLSNFSNSSCALTFPHTPGQGLIQSKSGQVTPEVPVRSLFWVWCRQLLKRVLLYLWNMSYKTHGSVEHLMAILLPHSEKLSENKTKQSSLDCQSYHLISWIPTSWISQLSKPIELPIYLFVCFWLWFFWVGFLTLSTK